jgi:hypothetical protein
MTRITNYLLLGLLTKPPDHRGGLADVEGAADALRARVAEVEGEASGLRVHVAEAEATAKALCAELAGAQVRGESIDPPCVTAPHHRAYARTSDTPPKVLPTDGRPCNLAQNSKP